MSKKVESRDLYSSSVYRESVDHAYASREPMSFKKINKPKDLKMPKAREMAKSLGKSIAKTAKAAIKGDKIIASSDLALQRTAICKSCPWFVSKGQRCAKCGCVVPMKVYFEEEECPVKKW